MLLEQLHYNLLFHWFVGLNLDDPVWHPTTFNKNRDRLLNDEVMGRFLEKLMGAPEVKLTWTLKTDPVLMRASLPARLGLLHR